MYKPSSSSSKKRPSQTKKQNNNNINQQKSKQKIHHLKKNNSINMKQFKMEIDHQISKCLDTLGRKQLKYLRQTMKLSNFFQSNDTNLKQESNQDQREQHQNNEKNIPQEIGSQEIQNKISKRSPIKKKNNKNSDQIDQQIQEDLQQIADEIEIDQDYQQIQQQTKTNNLSSKNQSYNYINNNNSKKIQHITPRPISALINKNNKPSIIEQNFIKANFKQQQKIVSKPFDKSFRKDSKQKINLAKKETKQQLQQNKVESKNQIQFNQNIINFQQVSQDEPLKDQQKKNVDQIIKRIAKLSPKKINTLEKILEKLQYGQQSSQQPYLFNREQINMASKVTSKAASRITSAKSARGSKKGSEKASVIQGSFNKDLPSKHNQQKLDIQSNQIGEEIEQHHHYESQRQPQTNSFLLQSEDQQFKNSNIQIFPAKIKFSLKKQKITEQKKQASQQNLLNKQSSASTNEFGSKKINPLYQSNTNANKINKVQSTNQFENLSNTQSKMVKVGKKKNQGLFIYNIKLTILGNRGHPSMVGLTSVQIFSSKGQKVLISKQNIKFPKVSQKILNLFNGINKTIDEKNMMVVVLNNGIFQLIMNIQFTSGDKIGGIRIWNYNKSQLQSSKQTDKIKIQINEEKVWQGSIKKGSYNQFQNYSTQIKIQEDFQFPLQNNNQLSVDQNLLNLSQKAYLNPAWNKQSQNKKQAHWLQKTLVEQKMQQLKNKQYEFQEKQKNIKINTIPIRNSIAQKPKNIFNISQENQLKIQFPEKFQINQKQKTLKVSKRQMSDNKIENLLNKSPLSKENYINDQNDIFSKFSKSKNQDPQIKTKQQPSQQQLKKIQERQDRQFQQLISPLKADKFSSQANKKIKEKPTFVQQVLKKINNQRIDDWDKDFMDDSMFKQPPKKVQRVNKQYQSKHILASQKSAKKQQISKNTDINDLLEQLNDMMGVEETDIGQQIKIPQFPLGKCFQIIVYSNWGDSNFTGLNGIQFFNKQGQITVPIKFEVDGISQNQSTLKNLFSGSYFTTDESSQWKMKKNNKNILKIQLYHPLSLSLIRFWNYNGHRVHSNRGIKKCLIKLDGTQIFKGEIRKASGCSQNTHKFCQYILFTNNPSIIKKITEKDWLTKIRKRQKQQNKMFRDTLSNFQRPKTKNSYQLDNKNNEVTKKVKVQIKLPKRNCNQYDPPLFPQGYTIKLILHQTWGDRYFVGLNGIQIFDQEGSNILKDNKNFIMTAQPSSVCILPGYQKDQRVCQNLVNEINQSSLDKNIWLTPFQSDIDRIQKGEPNTIIFQFKKAKKISAINIYNYSKTPMRGVRQIEIQVDNILVYRGYVRIYNENNAYTTFNFTKDPTILQQVGYLGYHEDNLEQNVGLINEQKIIKKGEFYGGNNQGQKPLTGQSVF